MRNMFNTALGRFHATKDDIPAEVLLKVTNELKRDLADSEAIATESIKAIIPTAARIVADYREEKRLDRHYKEQYERIDRSFARTKKGVTIAGGVGCGKTIAMKALSYMTGAKLVSIPELALIFSSSGISAALEQISPRSSLNAVKQFDIIIDDLGAEQQMKNYGQAFPIEEIIMKRYNEMHDRGWVTHFATNLNGKEISARYGERISSRIIEMTNIIVVNDGSLRA